MGEPETPPPKASRTRVWWSALAVILAASVLLAVLAVRLAPAGTRMAENSVGGPSPIGPTCTHYPGAEVSIAVPDPGRIVVSATVGVGIGHAYGTNDTARIVVAATSTDCAISNYTAFLSVPASVLSSASFFETVPVLRQFHVSSSATYTFYVNGAMDEGWDTADRFDSASLVAVYYPE